MTVTDLEETLADLLVEVWNWNRKPREQRAIERLKQRYEVTLAKSNLSVRQPALGEVWIEDPTAIVVDQPSDDSEADLVVVEVIRPGVYSRDRCVRPMQVILGRSEE